ncbi:MAG: DNA polymerase III subunit gamma/tau [Ignavibacteriaceae bacterium]|nr:DNA polymerase III subunit gamma/tau [Ignavibacteriaceae bacterium]
MAFVVTARKWRPQKFSDVVGQEHITATLKNAIKNNRIAHAYLFTGPRGVGKTTTARILAKALNCQNPQDAEPCNECEMCNSIQNTQSMDIIEIDGASNRGIDEIRTLRDSVKYAPTKGKYKIYIIDEVHMLTKESFNAFLKTLEEPPAHTIFIFATTDIHKVPLTIISRCQRFDFRRIQLDTIKTLLSKIAEEENIRIDDKTLTIIAKKADGALRDAESFFDQIVSFCGNDIESTAVAKMLNLIDDELFFTISDAVLNKNFKAVFEVTKQIYDNGWNFIDFMDGLIEHFRNIMTVVLSKNANQVEAAEIYKSRYLNYIDQFSEGDILRLFNFLNKAQQELRYSLNQRLKIEISLSHLIGLEKTATISDLISDLNSTGSPSTVTINEPVRNNYTSQSSSTRVHTAPVINTEKPKQPVSSTSTVHQRPASYSGVEDPNFNFDSVVKKWAGFVESISQEKSYTFGPFIKDVKLLGLEGNKISIYTNYAESKNVVKFNQDYIHQKTLEFFGKRMTFHLSEEAGSAGVETPDIPTQKDKSEDPKESTGDPYIDAIVNELGGEEIS